MAAAWDPPEAWRATFQPGIPTIDRVVELRRLVEAP